MYSFRPLPTKASEHWKGRSQLTSRQMLPPDGRAQDGVNPGGHRHRPASTILHSGSLWQCCPPAAVAPFRGHEKNLNKTCRSAVHCTAGASGAGRINRHVENNRRRLSRSPVHRHVRLHHGAGKCPRTKRHDRPIGRWLLNRAKAFVMPIDAGRPPVLLPSATVVLPEPEAPAGTTRVMAPHAAPCRSGPASGRT